MRKIPRLKMILRDNWLGELCRGKRVLHVGCADFPMMPCKLEHNTLLHGRLAQAAAEVVGVDINKAGIETLSRLMLKQKFLVHDAEELEQCATLGASV